RARPEPSLIKEPSGHTAAAANASSEGQPAATAEPVQERIARELATVEGALYYPQGGFEFEPFRTILPKTPRVRRVYCGSAHYFQWSDPAEQRRGVARLLRDNGFTVDEASGEGRVGWLNVSMGSRHWELEIHKVHSLFQTLRAVVPGRVIDDGRGI